MNSIYFESQIFSLEEELASLQAQLRQKREQRKELLNKKLTVEKTIANFEKAYLKLKDTLADLGEAAVNYKAIAADKVKELFKEAAVREEEKEDTPSEQSSGAPPFVPPFEGKPSGRDNKGKRVVREEIPLKAEKPKLISFPRDGRLAHLSASQVSHPPKNSSNEYIEWQPTHNPLVGSLFNIAKGKTQSAYIGSNNKKILASVSSSLLRIMPGVSSVLRDSKRLESTYELKVVGLNEEDIGYFTQFDFSKEFYPQFCHNLKASYGRERLDEYSNLKPGTLIAHNYFPAAFCRVIGSEEFGTVKVANVVTGAEFSASLMSWHLPNADEELSPIANIKDGLLWISCPSKAIAESWITTLIEDWGLTARVEEKEGKHYLCLALGKDIALKLIHKIDFSKTGEKPFDYLSLKEDIDILQERLGMTPKQSQEYIQRNYNKRSRLFMSERELAGYADYLRERYNRASFHQQANP